MVSLRAAKGGYRRKGFLQSLPSLRAGEPPRNANE